MDMEVVVMMTTMTMKMIWNSDIGIDADPLHYATNAHGIRICLLQSIKIRIGLDPSPAFCVGLQVSSRLCAVVTAPAAFPYLAPNRRQGRVLPSPFP